MSEVTKKAIAVAPEQVVQIDKKAMTASRRIIVTEQDKIKASGTKLNELVNANALRCLKHAETYGDATLMLRLFQSLPPSFNSQGLRFWVSQWSPIAVNGDANKVGLLKPDAKNYKPFASEEAAKEPFYAMKEVKSAQQRDLQPFSELVLLQRVINLPATVKNSTKEDSPRPFDDTYGTRDEILADLEELTSAATRIKARAEARHEARIADKVNKRSATRLIARGTKEHKDAETATATAKAPASGKTSKAA